MNFNLSQIPERTTQPRTSGLTMIMDKGLSINEVHNFMSVGGPHSDVIKLGFGTSFVTPNLKQKLEAYQSYNIPLYFGGTLLGIPGLINAYKTATALALQLSPIIKKPIEIPYELNFDYHQMNEVMMLVKHYNCSVVEQTAQLFIQLHIGIPKNRLDEVLEKLGTLRDVTIKTTLKVD